LLSLVTVTEAPDDLAAARRLFSEYQEELGIDLCFQGFQEELETLPGKYAPPRGCLTLLRKDDQFVGCAAIRDLGDGIAELKRLYVQPESRDRGYGRLLLATLIERARESGFERIRLDTLRRLEPACRLYEKFGFHEIQPYNVNPEPDIAYFELGLK
jgi:GNAT superfamily N-acetyltransferase